MRNSRLVVDDIKCPEPKPGEVLVKTLACGICGSDLHALKFGQQMVDTSVETGGAFVMDLARDVVMGHEFCAEIQEHGPGTAGKFPLGTRVCSVPMTLRDGVPCTVGYSNEVPGGYAENMVLFEENLLAVPNGLSTEFAALTEPMAVGYHAVAKSRLAASDIPLVIGCGPVGLAVIAALKLQGAGPVIAADFSPARRRLAEVMGADVIIDPGSSSPYESWLEMATANQQPGDPIPIPPGAVIFECVGIPGMIKQVMAGAPPAAKIVVVGVCMEADQLQPLVGINKELNIQFVLGYTADEFALTLHNIAEGVVEVGSLITSRVGFRDVPGAFEALADPELHAKIMVDPSL